MTKDMAQLAQYMATIGRVYVGTNMCVGFLIDECRFRVAFAPFVLHGDLLLPIVFFSPVLNWREGTSINRGVCVSL